MRFKRPCHAAPSSKASAAPCPQHDLELQASPEAQPCPCAGLGRVLAGFSEDTLHLALETLTALLRADPPAAG